MKNTFKRLLSFAVALVMILGLLPVTQLEVKAEVPSAPAAPAEITVSEHINDALVFAEGTKEAMCYACGKPVTWT
jgi:hypothetical protein